MDTQQLIRQQVTENPVVLYMKGTPQMPQCGFSAMAVQVLQACGVRQFFSVNVLENPDIRQGIKQMWEEGPGGPHYENILGKFKEIGCGIHVAGNEITVVIDFAAR